jgi:hypothetical protein
VAGIAESHPRLLVWLAEGRVTWYWNLFGTVFALLQFIPGLRWLMWRLLFKPVALTAPWRPELRERILQERRRTCNEKLRQAEDAATLSIRPTPGLSAVTDGTTIGPPTGCHDLRRKVTMIPTLPPQY